MLQGLEVKTVPTKPIEGQKTGTSGLRKKTTVFTSENYLANWSDPTSKRIDQDAAQMLNRITSFGAISTCIEGM